MRKNFRGTAAACAVTILVAALSGCSGLSIDAAQGSGSAPVGEPSSGPKAEQPGRPHDPGRETTLVPGVLMKTQGAKRVIRMVNQLMNQLEKKGESRLARGLGRPATRVFGSTQNRRILGINMFGSLRNLLAKGVKFLNWGRVRQIKIFGGCRTRVRRKCRKGWERWDLSFRIGEQMMLGYGIVTGVSEPQRKWV